MTICLTITCYTVVTPIRTVHYMCMLRVNMLIRQGCKNVIIFQDFEKISWKYFYCGGYSHKTAS